MSTPFDQIHEQIRKVNPDTTPQSATTLWAIQQMLNDLWVKVDALEKKE